MVPWGGQLSAKGNTHGTGRSPAHATASVGLRHAARRRGGAHRLQPSHRGTGRDGGMIALDAYIKAKSPDGVPQGEYLPAPWGLYTWKSKQYGVPLQAAIKNFIYNKDYFAEAGITKLPTTWPDFVDVGKKLVRKQGDTWTRSFLNFTTDLNRPWHEFPYRNNAKRVTDDLTKSLVNSPESVQTLQY